MVSTSPLWILLTSPAAGVAGFQSLLVCALNAILLAALAAVWSSVYGGVVGSSKKLERIVAGVVVFFTAAPSSVGLMETPCALLFVGVGLLGILKERWWGVPCSVAAVFARPECAVFLLVALGLKIARRQRFRTSEIVAGVTVGAILGLWQLSTFGAIYPHTAHVKEIVYDLSVRDFIRFAFISGYGDWTAKTVIPYLVVALVLAALWLIFRFKESHVSSPYDGVARQREFVLVFVFPAVVILAAYTLKRVLIFPWYSPLFLVPAHLAILRLFVLSGWSGRALCAILLAPLAIVSCQISAAVLLPSYAPFFEAGARARHLRAVGRGLAAEFPSAVLMAPEIGALGLEFSGKIIDAVGLASPEALSFHPLRVPEQRPTGFHGGVPAAFVAKERPTLVVGLDAFMWDFLRSPENAAYEIRKLSPADPEDLKAFPNGRLLGSTELIVAVKRGDAPGVPQER